MLQGLHCISTRRVGICWKRLGSALCVPPLYYHSSPIVLSDYNGTDPPVISLLLIPYFSPQEASDITVHNSMVPHPSPTPPPHPGLQLPTISGADEMRCQNARKRPDNDGSPLTRRL
ncbi:hypothetical protein J6590_013982 [Homalodisca vitripennis]|nr:hypothetical protein J6590_013982 [Homalodisca vitripennis]